ncbi:MAG: luciferase [Acidimicrobiaceae bacterium]|jgi:alkanesulfonate monooxygenase SsuD/methylene tetrahydromethanopterin reductase-like flavin-dependent oxidoreductase (luciferase family)|nr:luciferase [Acidimicrobiaceae bacterium]
MRFGLFLPPFGDFADPLRVVELAGSAEEAGWDGLFLWDHLISRPGLQVADPWTTMAAIATATTTLRFGALVTPLARRRPWTLARQMATLDRLSGGRLIAGVGLGDDGWGEFSAFGEERAPTKRGKILDEALEVLKGLLSGQPYEHRGEHFSLDAPAFLPRPVQEPLPIWAACRWPNSAPLARAATLQGCFPIFQVSDPPPPPDPGDIAALRRRLQELGAGSDYDIVVRCAFSLEEPATVRTIVANLTEAGVTWMLEAFAPDGPPTAVVEEIVRSGPPRT